MISTNRLLNDDPIQQRWEIKLRAQEPAFDQVLKAWREARRSLMANLAMWTGKEPVLRATMHPETLLDVTDTSPRFYVQHYILNDSGRVDLRLNGMFMAPSTTMKAGLVVIELLGILR